MASLALPALFAAALSSLAIAAGHYPGASPGTLAGTETPPDAALLTVAEASEFRATARHADVVALLDRLAAASPLARRAELGTSGEGRSLPMLILSDPPVATAAEARALAREQGRVIVLAIGNIHAGEVDGKEALPMLARELLGLGEGRPGAAGKPDPILKQVIFVIAPIYNADGNERVAKTNRPGQLGPDEGMGVRENAAGLDLNRDFIKVESPEGAALVRAFNEWDPHVFIDTHTTNGSFHRYVLTYAGPKAPAGDQALVAWSRGVFFPALSGVFDRPAGDGERRSFWYGSFEGAFSDVPPQHQGHTRWETFPAQARYGTTYVGLRNRLSVLSEAYSYAPFKDRVLATRDFCRDVLQVVGERRGELVSLLASADARTVSAGDAAADDVAIRTRAAPWPEKVKVLGYRESVIDGKAVKGEPTEYECELWDRFEPTLAVRRPWAYVLEPSPDMDKVVAKLRQHGVRVGRLAKPAKTPTETYVITNLAPASRAFQGHVLVTVSATITPPNPDRPEDLAAGAWVVRTGQPLGNLAVYLLEPACEDGLATWNAYDRWLAPEARLPIHRLPEPIELAVEPVEAAIRP